MSEFTTSTTYTVNCPECWVVYQFEFDGMG